MSFCVVVAFCFVDGRWIWWKWTERWRRDYKYIVGYDVILVVKISVIHCVENTFILNISSRILRFGLLFCLWLYLVDLSTDHAKHQGNQVWTLHPTILQNNTDYSHFLCITNEIIAIPQNPQEPRKNPEISANHGENRESRLLPKSQSNASFFHSLVFLIIPSFQLFASKLVIVRPTTSFPHPSVL